MTIVGVSNSQVYLADILSGKKLRAITIAGAEKVDQCSFSRDGMRGLVLADLYPMTSAVTAVNLDTEESVVLASAPGPQSFQVNATGSKAITADLDERLLIWDLSTGKVTARIVTDSDKDASLVFDESGEVLGIPGWDTLRLAFSPDGARIAAISSRSAMLRIWDTMTSRELLAVRASPTGVQDQESEHILLRFSPDGRQIAVHDRKTIRLLQSTQALPAAPGSGNVGTWERQVFGLAGNARRGDMPPLDLRRDAIFSRDGNVFVVREGHGLVTARDAETGRWMWEISNRQGFLAGLVWPAVFSANGQRMAYPSRDNVAHVMEVVGEAPRREYSLQEARGEHRTIEALALTGDAGLLASRLDNSRIIVWDVARGEPVFDDTLSPATRTPLTISSNPLGAWVHDDVLGVSDNGRLLWALDGGKTVRVWCVSSRREVYRFAATDVPFAVSPDGSWLAHTGSGPTIHVWDVAPQTRRHSIMLPGLHVHGLQVSPNGRTLVVAVSSEALKDRDSLMTVWANERLELMEHARIRCYDVRSGQETLAFEQSRGVVAFSPNGRNIAWGGTDNLVRLADVTTGRVLREFHGHDAPVTSLAFNSDGKRLASGAEDRRILIWDAATDVALLTLRGHKAEVVSLRFSPEGTRLASFSAEGRVSVWDVTENRRPAGTLHERQPVLRFPDLALLPQRSEAPPEESFRIAEEHGALGKPPAGYGSGPGELPWSGGEDQDLPLDENSWNRPPRGTESSSGGWHKRPGEFPWSGSESQDLPLGDNPWDHLPPGFYAPRPPGWEDNDEDID